MAQKTRVQFNDPKGKIIEAGNRDGILCYGSTVPADNTAGYSPGCIWVKQGGTGNLVLYINNGTNASCAFKPTSSIGPVSLATAGLTVITHTAPGTPDYAIQDLINASAYGFVTKDEGNTVLSVVKNLQTKMAEIEVVLRNANLIV